MLGFCSLERMRESDRAEKEYRVMSMDGVVMKGRVR